MYDDPWELSLRGLGVRSSEEKGVKHVPVPTESKTWGNGPLLMGSNQSERNGE